jgi:SAM-dependent methyltransferase
MVRAFRRGRSSRYLSSSTSLAVLRFPVPGRRLRAILRILDPRSFDDMSQYAQSAEWYDRIYAGAGKDYAAEADAVLQLAHRHAPGAASLLDVGCGTGLHLQRFASKLDVVAGVDLDPGFVAAARRRDVDVAVGDMRTFDLDRRFDIVTSLYSAVGHLGSTIDLVAAVANMARHLAPGGVLVLEPWILEGDWRDGDFGVEISDAPDSILTRVNHTSSDGNVSVLTCSWSLVDATGITRVEEELRLTRFTESDYRSAIERAGLVATFDAAGCNDDGRGLWVGVHA